jgi:hypothetical protein
MIPQRLDDMHDQGVAGVEMPLLVGLEAVQGGKGIGGQQKIDGGGKWPRPGKAGRKTLVRDPLRSTVGLPVPASLGVGLQVECFNVVGGGFHGRSRQ